MQKKIYESFIYNNLYIINHISEFLKNTADISLEMEKSNSI
jgi:hypothetical protein